MRRTKEGGTGKDLKEVKGPPEGEKIGEACTRSASRGCRVEWARAAVGQPWEGIKWGPRRDRGGERAVRGAEGPSELKAD